MAKTALISSICRSEGGRCAAHPGWRPTAGPSSLSSMFGGFSRDLISFLCFKINDCLSIGSLLAPGLGVAGGREYVGKRVGRRHRRPCGRIWRKQLHGGVWAVSRMAPCSGSAQTGVRQLLRPERPQCQSHIQVGGVSWPEDREHGHVRPASRR